MVMEFPLGSERLASAGSVENKTVTGPGAAVGETSNATNARPIVCPAPKVSPLPLYEISPAESEDPVLVFNGCGGVANWSKESPVNR
jgi:hypothetical protein